MAERPDSIFSDWSLALRRVPSWGEIGQKAERFSLRQAEAQKGKEVKISI